MQNFTLDMTTLHNEKDWSPNCENSTNTNLFNFTIRAIVAVDGNSITGLWSNPITVPAYCKGWLLLKLASLLSWVLSLMPQGVKWSHEKLLILAPTFSWLIKPKCTIHLQVRRLKLTFSYKGYVINHLRFLATSYITIYWHLHNIFGQECTTPLLINMLLFIGLLGNSLFL